MQKNEMFRCDQDDLKKLWIEWLFYYSAKHFFKTIGLRRPVFEFNGCNLQFVLGHKETETVAPINFWMTLYKVSTPNIDKTLVICGPQ